MFRLSAVGPGSAALVLALALGACATDASSDGAAATAGSATSAASPSGDKEEQNRKAIQSAFYELAKAERRQDAVLTQMDGYANQGDNKRAKGKAAVLKKACPIGDQDPAQRQDDPTYEGRQQLSLICNRYADVLADLYQGLVVGDDVAVTSASSEATRLEEAYKTAYQETRRRWSELLILGRVS